MEIHELQDWFEQHVTSNGKPYKLDEEQAKIVLNEHKNTIVTARAGSGKTHTLIAKIIYLIVMKGINPEHIIALGFNHDPQEDFRKRLSEVMVDGRKVIDSNNQIARTFHSLAYNIVKPKGSILYDDKKNSIYDRSKYIHKIVKDIVDPQTIYDFVRDDSYEPKQCDYSNDEDYYLAIKNTVYETLNGETVRSRGEKIIADYLFEHGIDYGYEMINFYPQQLCKYAKNESTAEELSKKELIIPDFYLKKQGIIWEHWGIAGDETEEEIEEINQSGVIGVYQEYDENKKYKEWFYSKEWLDFSKIRSEEKDGYLENFFKMKDFMWTDYQKGISREEFERIIEEKLREKGIYNSKLSQAELLDKFNNAKTAFDSTTDRVAQFINRAELQFPNDFSNLKNRCLQETEKETKLFYKVALAAYKYYLDDLLDTQPTGSRLVDRVASYGKIYTCDYPILMDWSAKAIREYSENKDFVLDFDNIEYILLDEYQDFSLLFLNLIKAIAMRSSNAKILAVGDDWQAINGYTGASLEYFNNFEQYFPEDNIRLKISTNRRSVKAIVDAANNFMRNSIKDNDGAVCPDGTPIGTEALNQCILSMIANKKPKYGFSRSHRKYNQLLGEIVKDNPNKTIKILNRTKDIKLEGKETKNVKEFTSIFVKKLSEKMKKYDLGQKITSSTINSAKGLEADIVILLESDIGRFPIFHPDNHLYKVFGQTEQKALDEQKRLFYVAITRAKEKVYIIHRSEKNCSDQEMSKDKKRQSDFLNMLEIKRFEKYFKDSFYTLQRQLELGKRHSFKAEKIEFLKDRYDINKENIKITSNDGDVAIGYGATIGWSCDKQMRELSKKCSEDTPQMVYVDAKKYKDRTYLNFYKYQQNT